MYFEWSDFSVIPDTPHVFVSLNERECSFLLTLLSYAQDRSNWPEISDADWDTVESFLAEIDTELMGAF